MNVKTLDSTKIYWLDKEETVKAKLVGLDLPNGSGSVKYTFRVIHGGTGDIIYMDSNLPKTIHEVVESKQWKFTTPIAMKCTEEQFNEIKGKLVEMGYKLSISCDLINGIWLVNNYSGVSNCFGLAYGTPFQKTKFNSFNPDLFLALAAMTDKKDGINGEWWTNGHILTKQDAGIFGNYSMGWRKATAQEIIEHFEKKEFILPEKWCVEITDKNVDILWSWTGFKFQKKSYINYVTYRKTHSKEIPENCTEIAFDQFKKYILKETNQSCHNLFSNTNTATYNQDGDFGFLFARRTIPNYLSGTIHMSSTPTEIKTIIPIPPTKQATLFDDRVEITDWEPKEGEIVWVVTNEIGSLIYKDVEYNGSLLHAFLFRNGFIKRTECEAKRLVEKLKQAML